MSNEQIDRFAEVRVDMEQLDIFIVDAVEDLLDLERIELLYRVLQRLLNFRIYRATMLKALHNIVHVVFLGHSVSHVNDCQRFTRLLLDGAIVGTTVPTGPCLLALVNHGLKNARVLALFLIALDTLEETLTLLLA